MAKLGCAPQTKAGIAAEPTACVDIYLGIYYIHLEVFSWPNRDRYYSAWTQSAFRLPMVSLSKVIGYYFGVLIMACGRRTSTELDVISYPTR